ncbi:MAG: hypothetical protein ACYSW3_27080 [Planctomycetota bacterium]|jgi:hypothetical protein
MEKTHVAYFKVEAMVAIDLTGNAADSALNNSEVLHTDVLDVIADKALNDEGIGFFQITLEEVLEYGEEGGK